MRSLRWILGLSVAFFFLFLGASAAVIFWQKSRSSHQAASPIFERAGDVVGILPINGVITDSKKVLKQLDHFAEESRVKAVVLRLDTPGGVVGPSQEIYEKVKKFPKPIIASMGSVAASGGYYIAAGTKRIFSNPGTITGSIGVIIELLNLKKLYEWAKIERYAIKSGKFKGSGAEYRELTPEEREVYQNMIDDVLGQFRAAVREGRHMTEEEVVAVSDGRIFSGARAKDVKLVDELGTIEDAIAYAGKMGKIEGKPKVVYPEKKRSGWIRDLIMDPPGEEDEEARAEGSRSFLAELAGRALEDVSGIRLPTSELAGSRPLPPGIYVIWNGQR